MAPASPDENPDLSALLAGTAMFRHLDEAQRRELAGRCEWFALPGGATLFEHGDASDALYLLRSGSLGAFRGDGHAGPPHLIGVVAAGETVGELGVIVDQPRSATVRALRDSELLRLSREAFQSLVERQPRAMLEAARVAVERLVARSAGQPLSAPRTLAILPQSRSTDAAAFAAALQLALADYGRCSMLDAGSGGDHTSAWFAAREAEARYVLYVADVEDRHRDWRELCVRQADALVLLADANAVPGPWPDIACASATAALHRPRHLVLLHTQGEIRRGAGRAWLAQTPGARLHHVRGARDAERVARLIVGRSLGLVLSGGGARGFAHIGVVRALREAGLRIDTVGGTSIGAIIGAGVAADWSDEEMLERYRRAFVDGAPLRDYTLPFVAMTRGARVARLLREAFGARDIEDLALPYFAVSANLTGGTAVVHREGPLWLWLRASCAIPGVLPPVLHRGQVLVDGAVINNLPTDVMREEGVADVAAVDIGADDVLHAGTEEFCTPPAWRLLWDRLHRPRRPGLLSILLRAGMVNAEAASHARRALASLLLTPPLGDVELLDWKAYERAIELGYRYAREVIGGERPRELP
ncbi:MAG: patatin-like phospholipase family protein [Lysobacterales bacterium]